MNKKFIDPQLFALPIKKEAKQKLIDQCYPLTFKLKRIDFACDIYKFSLVNAEIDVAQHLLRHLVYVDIPIIYKHDLVDVIV